MAKINVLDSSVYNRIAAGEVVERPYSVVKELVENSIDAGAKNIQIDIFDGGISSIKITDDGCGIERDELKKSLLPHATSKIAKAEDLDAIATLGFRGEALASIASISKIRIASKPAAQEFGAAISSEGGKNEILSECALSDGTEITVEDIFFNTPARQKFLKTAKSEEGDISGIVTRFILGNPTISFRYTANGKLIYQSYGDGLESAMLSVYGKSTLDNCFFIDSEKYGIRLSGYIGKHHFSKPNRTYQSMFVNGRYVFNNTLSSAITNAYGAYLMKRQYPFYVLNLSVPTEIVDVNVHPNKTDVRFANNQIIYGSVYSVVSKVLDGSSDAVNIVKSEGEEPFVKEKIKDKCDVKEEKIVDFTSKNISTFIPKTPSKTENKLSEKVYVEHDIDKSYPKYKEPECEMLAFYDHTHAPDVKEVEKAVQPSEKAKDIFEENKKYLEELYNKKQEQTLETDKNSNIKKQQEITIERQLVYVGQTLNTYLIFEDGQDLFIIDQHAAHERILFDRFCEKSKNNELAVQTLLVPYVFKVNNEENAFLKEKLGYLTELGIDIGEFGFNTYKISALPSEIAQFDIREFLDDCMSDLNFFKRESVSNIIREKLASMACKAAIKAGDKLDEKDIAELMRLLNGNLGLKCPHGRPIAVKISRTEIEKWFKRIV